MATRFFLFIDIFAVVFYIGQSVAMIFFDYVPDNVQIIAAFITCAILFIGLVVTNWQELD